VDSFVLWEEIFTAHAIDDLAIDVADTISVAVNSNIDIQIRLSPRES
jgi:hypothetical protein